MYILCDSVRIEYPDGKIEFFQIGDIIYIPKELRYYVKFSGDTEHLDALLINFSILGEGIVCDRVVRLISNAPTVYADAFRKIISLYTQTKNYRYGIMENFYRLLNEIDNCIESNTALDPLYQSIMPAITYIESHINERLRIGKLAKLCLLSESAFRKRFKICTEKTPTEYISDLKLEKATELLKSTDIPINTIVSELNFYDSAYFYKLFRKKTGVAPSLFRKA